MVKGIQKYNMYDFSALINTLVECNINEIENSRTVYLCTSSIVLYVHARKYKNYTKKDTSKN